MDRIKSKRVGRVNICEIYGDFRDGFARRGKAALAQLAQGLQTPDLLLNLKDLENADRFGLDVLRECGAYFRKSALLIAGAPLEANPDAQNLTQKYHVAKNLCEAASFFQRELAEAMPGQIEGDERRGFVRLPVILPAKFHAHEQETPGDYFAVVTNLSEGGLYAEFIDSGTETSAAKNLDPFELKLLDVELVLTPDVCVKAGAKVVHAKKGEGGLGMEFYQFPAGDKDKLLEWLSRQLAQPNRSQGAKTS